MGQYLVFVLGKQHYAVDIALIEGVSKKYAIIVWPGLPQAVKGVMALRENIIIPVIDTQWQWRICQQEQRMEHLIITEEEGQKIGWLVDEVIEIINLEKEDKIPIEWHKEIREKAIISQVAIKEGKIIGIVSERAFHCDWRD